MGPYGYYGPPGGRPGNDPSRDPLPNSPKEVPAYVFKIVKNFFFRLFYVFTLIWEAKPLILFVMLFMCAFDGVMPVIGAFITKALIDSLVGAVTGEVTNFSVIISLLVFQFVYLFLNRIVSMLNNMITRISGEIVVNHIKVKIINKAKTIDLASFDLPSFYEKLENANREAGNRPISIINATFNMLSTIISMVSFIAVLASISALAPVLIIALAVPSAIINFIYRKKTFLYMRRRSKDRRKMNYYSDMLVNKDMAKEVRLLGLSDTFINRYKEVFSKYFAGIKKLVVSESLWHIGVTVLSMAVNCILFLYVAYKVFLRELVVGDYSLYTGALNHISSSVSTLISSTATIYEGTLFIDNMISFMNEKPTIQPRLAKPLVPKRHIGHKIEFKNVSFRYPGTDRDILKNINLTLNPGETAVLVGLNGAGKTTLIKLLTRLYDPTEGCVLLDGADLRDYDVSRLYDIFGILFQDFGKYAVTVSENIYFGDINREPVKDEIIKAATESNAAPYIEKLPDGYDTPLMRFFEDNGIELSIGQWQKLSISRAFYKDSDILILDEPTASLDPMAEQEIFNQFDSLRQGKTTIFVSHRLSSATTASKIIVMENGQIIEEGSHAELMSSAGRYCELFTTQAKRYISSSENGT